MKLICNPKNWQEALEINDEQRLLLQTVAKRLGLTYNFNEAQNKVYLGLPPVEVKAELPSEHEADFVMSLPKKPSANIIDGVIMLAGKQYKACSGLPYTQVFGTYYDRYCPIPPGEYSIDLAWYNCDTVGIEGPYYHITPDPIVDPSGTGKYRSEIGLHKDNNTPGTAGCIGVVGGDWDALHKKLQELARSQKTLKLVVSYLCRD